METDEELLERIGGNDEGAFDAFYARNREPILRHVQRIVVDENAAEDVVQETFLRVWNKAEQWQHRGTARGWVFRIATNLSLNLLESRRRSNLLARTCSEEDEDTQDLLLRIAETSDAGPEEALQRNDWIRILRDSVGRLSEPKRLIMDMYLDGEVTLREIARRLGIPLGTVKSRFHYASRELRELLDDSGEWRDT